MNTDFIDNSAGVDTSDREVNIKILLDTALMGHPRIRIMTVRKAGDSDGSRNRT